MLPCVQILTGRPARIEEPLPRDKPRERARTPDSLKDEWLGGKYVALPGVYGQRCGSLNSALIHNFRQVFTSLGESNVRREEGVPDAV